MTIPRLFIQVRRAACWLAALIVVADTVRAATPPVTQVSDLAKSMQWVGVAVSDPDYYTWCTSPIVGLDEKIHLFCSRWPKVHKMDGWRTHSEIVHYIGEKPEGPFVLHGVAIPGNPGAPWNNTIHNPAIAQVGDQFVLLYISFGWRKDNPAGTGRSPMFTGMAIADSINGPWKVLSTSGPIVVPSKNPDHWSAGTWALDNPTFLAHQGKYYIYLKGG